MSWTRILCDDCCEPIAFCKCEYPSGITSTGYFNKDEIKEMFPNNEPLTPPNEDLG